MKAVYYILGVVTLLVLGLVVLITGQNHSGYSIVYLDNSTVPSSLYIGNETTIVFGIQSYEHVETNYSFYIYLNGRLIQNGSVSLNPHQNVQIPVKLLVRNVTYSRIVIKNITTSYIMSGVTNITTTLCAPVNSSSNWSCSPPIYKGALGLSFVLNETGNVSINKTTYTMKNNGLIVTLQTFSIVKEGPEKYRVILGTLEWMKAKNDAFLQIVVHSSIGKVYVLSHYFNVAKG